MKSPGQTKRLFEIRRQFVFQLDPLSRYGVLEGDTPGVKEGSAQLKADGLLPSPAVGSVAQDGVPYGGEVHADLVRPAGSGPCL
jgi:hypothetical protein